MPPETHRSENRSPVLYPALKGLRKRLRAVGMKPSRRDLKAGEKWVKSHSELTPYPPQTLVALEEAVSVVSQRVRAALRDTFSVLCQAFHPSGCPQTQNRCCSIMPPSVTSLPALLKILLGQADSFICLESKALGLSDHRPQTPWIPGRPLSRALLPTSSLPSDLLSKSMHLWGK